MEVCYLEAGGQAIANGGSVNGGAVASAFLRIENPRAAPRTRRVTKSLTSAPVRSCRRRRKESLISTLRKSRPLGRGQSDQRLLTSSPTMTYVDFVTGPASIPPSQQARCMHGISPVSPRCISHVDGINMGDTPGIYRSNTVAIPWRHPTMRTAVKPFGLVFYVMVVVWSGRGLRGSLLPRLRG